MPVNPQGAAERSDASVAAETPASSMGTRKEATTLKSASESGARRGLEGTICWAVRRFSSFGHSYDPGKSGFMNASGSTSSVSPWHRHRSAGSSAPCKVYTP